MHSAPSAKTLLHSKPNRALVETQAATVAIATGLTKTETLAILAAVKKTANLMTKKMFAIHEKAAKKARVKAHNLIRIETRVTTTHKY